MDAARAGAAPQRPSWDPASSVARSSLPQPDPAAVMKLLGSGIWPAAFVLAEELQAARWRQAIRGASVLELGAGASGFPGMVAALSGGPRTRVVLTDKHPELVSDLERGLRENGLISQCTASVYEWGAEASGALCEESRPFDVILGSDCLYSHGTTGAFCDALEQLSGAATAILVSAEDRWSRSECLPRDRR